MKFNLIFSLNFILIFVFVFLIHCGPSTPKGQVKIKTREHEFTFIEKVKNYQLDLINLDELSFEEKAFLDIVNSIINSEFSTAEEKAFRILESFPYISYKNEIYTILVNALIFQSKWDKLLPASALIIHDPDSVFILAEAFSKLNSEKVNFFEDKDTISFFTSPSGAIIVPVEINGNLRHFWFDTGTNYTILSSKTAEDCNILPLTQRKSKALTTTNYKVDVKPSVISSFKLGSMQLLNHPCLIVDDFNLRLRLLSSNVPTEIYGIVGWKAIKNAKFVLDYIARRIIIEKPLKLSIAKDRNFFWVGIPIVLSKLDDVNILFAFDLGAEKSALTYNVFNKVDFGKIYEQTKVIGSVGGWKFNPSLVVPYFEVTIDKSKIVFKDIHTVEMPKDYLFNIDGVLGLDILKLSVISFDILNSKFEIKAVRSLE
ncbi:MAG: aspartyl protease family protein [Ignavibacteria bacterium]|nr:aspartyl protease family protein [Ignavibacteria bacterium]